jgi:hypothetical protein
LYNINWWKFKPEQTQVTPEENSSSNEKPNSFFLRQNYPNPFNPTTTITYSVAKAGTVELKVYDVLGEEVAILVNDVKPAGQYIVVFDGADLSSGVYYYTMTFGTQRFTRKMMLVN